MSAFTISKPFKARKKTVGKDRIVIVNGEEVITGTHHNYAFDKEKFLKVYMPMLNILDKITPTSIKILTKILRYMASGKYGGMIICISPYEFEEIMTKMSFYRGIKQLIEFNVIAKTNIIHQYEINPNFIFNGNRVKYIERMRNED